MSATSPPAPRLATFEEGLVAIRSGDRRAAIEVAIQQVGLGLIPLVVLAVLAKEVLSGANAAVDFQNAYWTAGHRLLTGGNPYAWTAAQVRDSVAFVYPALSALIFVPFALVPKGTGVVLATFACMAAAPAVLWTMQIRDWRIYGVTLVWLPVFGCWQTANETIFLVLMVALVWRCRERALVSGLLTAAAISLKPFIWPLAVWLLVTRRWRASAYTVMWAAVLNLVAWSVVGWGAVHAYLNAAAADTRDAWRAGYSIAAIASHLGLGHSGGDALTLAVCAGLVTGIAYVGLIKRREAQALVLTIALMLAASPLVWSHYFALLLIPMALERPRLSWTWALPLLMWVCPPSFKVAGWQEAVAWLVAGTMFVTLMRRAPA